MQENLYRKEVKFITYSYNDRGNDVPVAETEWMPESIADEQKYKASTKQVVAILPMFGNMKDISLVNRSQSINKSFTKTTLKYLSESDIM